MRYKKRNKRDGEAVFFFIALTLAVIALFLSYWKVTLLIGFIGFVLYVLLHKKGSVPVLIGNEHLSDSVDRKVLFRENSKRKGEEFEAHVADHYRFNGYDVLEHGKLYGRKDQGIDLIAINENETLLIQCKNWSASGRYFITHSHIKEFIGNTVVFLEKSPFYSDRAVRRLFVTSEDIFDRSAINYIRNNRDIVESQIIPML